MPYTKFHDPWENDPSTNTPINAAALDHIEQGVFDAIDSDIVDAKGDLIVATAADTVARKAVGANDEVLVADSAQTTGVKWAKVGNAMVASDAAIAGSKLKPARVAATLAGLPGSAEDGALALIRGAASPYDYMILVYDATYGKWVSTPVPVCSLYAYTAFVSTVTPGTAWGSAVAGIDGHFYPYKALYDAGLVPQFRLIARESNDTAGQTVTSTLGLQMVNKDGELDALVEDTSFRISVTGTSFSTKDTGWLTFDAAVNNKDFMLIEPCTYVSANNGRVVTGSCWLRWVSA